MESSGFSASFTDLMTSLAIIFILLLVATMSNVFQEGQSARNAILAQLQEELKTFSKDGVHVESDPTDPLSILIYVPENLLNFTLNSASIPNGGKEFLHKFVPSLSNVACVSRFSHDIGSIVVEGHTDDTGEMKDNVRLSQERSMSVVGESLGSIDLSQTDCFLKLLSATGRGSAELIYADNDTAKVDRDKSRRVIFKIRIKGVEQRDQVERHI